MNKFYEFWQNNSGGVFDGPAQKIFIQARSADDANELAELEFGVYFNGCEDGLDCECCGDRWSPAYMGLTGAEMATEMDRISKIHDEIHSNVGAKKMHAVIIRFDDGTVICYS